MCEKLDSAFPGNSGVESCLQSMFAKDSPDIDLKNEVLLEISRTNASLMTSHAYRPPLPANLPPESHALERLMRRCWHEDPAERPSFEQIAGYLKNKTEFSVPRPTDDGYLKVLFIPQQELDWKFARLLWIAFEKEEPRSCPMALLPREMIEKIIEESSQISLELQKRLCHHQSLLTAWDDRMQIKVFGNFSSNFGGVHENHSNNK